jgi:predicted CoA-substrate-specific enzyme activase
MTFIAGMDIGTISIKTMIISPERVISTSVFEAGASPRKTAVDSMQAALESAGIEYRDLSMIVTTGHGRNKIPFSNMTRSEISAIAKGARRIDPKIRIVADIGGQGIRVIRLAEDGNVENFLNNDKCSSGTGCFLDSMAIALKIGIEDMGELSGRSQNPSCLSTKCTIFAESEVVSLVARGTSREDIIAGLNQSVAQKVHGLVKSIGSSGKVMVCGGVVRNEGVLRELRKIFKTDMIVAPRPQLITVLGAAVYGLESLGGEAK